jgi:hypothetical protein
LSTHAIISGTVSTDIIGNVNYTFSDGTSGYSSKDAAGYTHYQFSNGLYGTAYTDLVGNTQYYFDSSQTNKYVLGVCNLPSNLTCTEESQYQDMYNLAAGGVATVNPREGQSGSFPSATPVSTEQAIMSGAYGARLQLCRSHIELYKTALINYNQCVKDETAKYQQYAQAKLDILKQQTDIQRQKIGLQNQILESTKKTCPPKSTLIKNEFCLCDVGLVMNKQETGCFTCEQLNPESFTEVYGKLTACTTCNEGYYLDKVAKSCILKDKTTIKDVSLSPTVVKKVQIKTLPIKKINNNIVSSTLINVPVDQISSSVPVISTSLERNVENFPKENKAENSTEAIKKGIFQKIGEKADSVSLNISSFFKKVVIKIKFW